MHANDAVSNAKQKTGETKMNNEQILNATTADLPRMIAFLVSKGWAADENTNLEGAKQMAQFQAFLDGTL